MAEAMQTEAPAVTETIPEAAAEPQASAGSATPAPPPAPAASPGEPWAIVGGTAYEDVYALEEHPDVAAHLQRRDRQVQERYHAESEERVKAATRRWESTELHRRLSGELGNILHKLDGADYSGIDKHLDSLERMIAPYQQDRDMGILQAGIEVQGNAVNGVLLSKLEGEEQKNMHDFLSKGNGAPLGEALDHWERLKLRPVQEAHKAELQRRNDVIESLKAQLRSGKGPNLAQSVMGGGNSINSMAEADRRYTLPAGHPEAIDHATYKELRQRFGAKEPWE